MIYFVLIIVSLFGIIKYINAIYLEKALREFISIMDDSAGVYLKTPVFPEEPPATVSWNLIKKDNQLEYYFKIRKYIK